MQPNMENPAAANCGVPKTDLAGASIGSESISPLRKLQASRLRRIHALAHETAITIATLAFGVAR
jgi:hypothetical protein